MPTAFELMQQRLNNTKKEPVEKAETVVEKEPEKETVTDTVPTEETIILATADAQLSDILTPETSVPKERKRRARKKATEPVSEVVKDTVEDTTPNFSETVTTDMPLIEIVPLEPDTNKITNSINNKESFDFNGRHWTPHKYKIGDVVYVPVDEQVTNDSMYDPIKVVLRKVPKKLTVATVSITNKVCYTFRETSKILAHERFVCDTEAECAEICKEFN